MAARSTLNKPADEAVDLRIGVGKHLPSHLAHTEPWSCALEHGLGKHSDVWM